MSDRFILNLFADLRKQILNIMTGLPENKLSLVPEGFNNNLHWQIGHVLTITNDLIFVLSGAGSRIPSSYGTFFATGTSPSNWSEQPPEVHILEKKLEEQMLVICEMYDGNLAEPVTAKDNFLQARVIGELFYVLIAHESTHLGMITAMAKVLHANPE
ncbi:DinB family protein [Paenibacillus chartarius]|uniref:DinB family protein n=1 Tax=Paenibacillus chartarius TaxID=747481 RepID=A0ABV6DP11_9BACL